MFIRHWKISNSGRNAVLFSIITIFLIASIFCGAAQNMNWLIICRAVQGIGGGGILQLVQITISDIVSLEEYAKSSWAPHGKEVEKPSHFLSRYSRLYTVKVGSAGWLRRTHYIAYARIGMLFVISYLSQLVGRAVRYESHGKALLLLSQSEDEGVSSSWTNVFWPTVPFQ